MFYQRLSTDSSMSLVVQPACRVDPMCCGSKTMIGTWYIENAFHSFYILCTKAQRQCTGWNCPPIRKKVESMSEDFRQIWYGGFVSDTNTLSTSCPPLIDANEICLNSSTRKLWNIWTNLTVYNPLPIELPTFLILTHQVAIVSVLYKCVSEYSLNRCLTRWNSLSLNAINSVSVNRNYVVMPFFKIVLLISQCAVLLTWMFE